MNPFLLAQSGILAGQRFELPAGAVTVGREAGNTIVLADPTVSRIHARISVINGVATLEDAGSSGGTYVNDARLSSPTVLKVGDVVRMGGTTLAFMPGVSVSPMGVTATMPTRAGRRKEVGSAERAQLPPAPAPTPVSGNTGCMPDFSNIGRDLDGCMPMLLRLLLIALIVVVVAAVIGGIVLLAGMAVSSLSSVQGAAGGREGGSGTTTGAGGSPPQQQPQDQQQQQQQQPVHAANGAIKIIRARTAYLPREGYAAPVPVALIDWKNVGTESVVEVFADVTSYDKAGVVIGLQRGVRIYTGAPVASEGTHQDVDTTDGVLLSLDQGKGQALDHAQVVPTEVRVASTSTPEE